MLDVLQKLFVSNQFIPHGHCYLWQPELVWLHILSDALIALAYYSIPITLVYFVRKRQDLPFNWIFLLFGTFIIACGTSHLMEIWTLWHPTYWLSGLIKSITAIVSVYTALELVPLVPKALALPSPAQLEAANRELQREIAERKQVEATLRETEERFRSAFDSAAIGMALVATDGRWLQVNRALCEIIGYCEQEMLAMTFQDITHPDDLDADLNYMQQILNREIRCYQIEKRYFHSSGHVVWILLNVSLVATRENETLYFIAQIQDITERKRAEQRLVAQYAVTHISAESTTVRAAYPQILQAICASLRWDVGELWSLDWQANVLRCVETWQSPSLEASFVQVNRQMTFAPNVGLPGRVWASSQPLWISDVVKDANFHQAEIAARVGLHGAFGFPILDGNQRLGVITFFSREIQQIDTDLLQMMAAIGSHIGQFIKRKQVEEALQRQLAAVEAAIDGIAILNQNSEYVYLNKAHAQMFGYNSSAELVGKTWKEFYYPDEISRIEAEIFPILRQKGHWQGEATAKKLDGSTFAEEISLTFTEDNSLVCVCHDISDRKQIESQIKASLQEKEVLLKEVHHRVKNNLQIIDSLFRHQCRKIKDQHIIEILKQCQNRVYSMALLHEKLYQSKDLSTINFPEYIKSIVCNLFDTQSFKRPLPKIISNIADNFLNIETALPCGLIINELVSNCYKYAFPKDEQGEININFYTNNEELVLSVKDNGIGISEDFDINKTQTLGLRLVKSLVRQLNGAIAINSSGGTEFIITIPRVKDAINT